MQSVANSIAPSPGPRDRVQSSQDFTFGHPLPQEEGWGVRGQPQRSNAHATLLMSLFRSLAFHSFLVLVTVCEAAVADEYRVIHTFKVADEPACMPALTQAPNGNLLVAFSTEWEPFPWGGILKLVVSKDRGKTWSGPRTLWQDKDPRVTIQVANGMQTLHNGDVLLPVTYCVVPKRPGVSTDEVRPSRIYDPRLPGYRREVRFLRSKDSGRNWSIEDPQLEKPWFRFGRLFETPDGRLIMPAEAAYFESRDHGRTWGRRISISTAAFNETNVVQAANGTLFSLMRQDGELGLRRMFGTSFSSDGGKSWSQWRWSGVQGKMPDTLVLPSGRILLGVGAEGLVDGSLVMKTKNRNSFCTLFLSDDHGQSWKRDMAFEPVSSTSSVVPADSPVMWPLGNQVLVVLQGIDRSRSADPLIGYRAGMSLIGNLIERVASNAIEGNARQSN